LRIITVPLAALLILLSSCTAAQPVFRRDAFLLNTHCVVTVYSRSDAALLDGVFARCRALEALLSHTIEGSDIYNLNNNHGIEIEIAPETRAVLEKAIYYAALSENRFDVTVGAVTSLWDFNTDLPQPPPPLLLAEALASVGIDQLLLTPSGAVLHGGRLDLGGIAKGYIADEMKKFLTDRGTASAIIDLGGDITVIGQKPNGSDYRIAVAKPFTQYSENAGEFRLRGVSAATTGTDQRYFLYHDRHYHHIIDVRTGYPAETGLLSVTVIHESGIDADALAAVFFLLGLEDGLRLAEITDGAEALFITQDNALFQTSGLESKYRFTASIP
jgi:thiamine biosynthesis lipoprotein